MKCLKIIILFFLFSSCNGLPPKKNITVERCFLAIESTILIDEKEYSTGFCRCHSYMVGSSIKRVSESENKPLLYCDKQASFKDYATTLYLFLEEWRIYLLQQ